MNQQYQRFGNGNQPIIFCHANGFHPDTYREFFDHFPDDISIFAPFNRALWGTHSPPTSASMKLFGEDTVELCEKHLTSPVTAIGHSLGGATLLFAALKNPNLFKKLILIDPLIIPLTNRIEVILSLFVRNPLVKKAKKRRTCFDSKDTIFNIYKNKPLFHSFTEMSLKNYIDASFKKTKQGQFELTYDKYWEASTFNINRFDYIYFWKQLEHIQLPVTILKASHQSILFRRTRSLLHRRKSQWGIETVPDSGHLMPMENPVATIQAILAHLN